MDTIALQQDLTTDQKMMFQNEMNRVQKNPTTALLWCLFLGGLGAHHYYMGRVVLGLLYTFFFWTFIPGFIALIELFLIKSRVRKYNYEQAKKIVERIKATAPKAAQA
jgi:TM2 domain-containing membrane protein YozV